MVAETTEFKNAPDVDLVGAVVCGSEPALAEIYSRYARPVFVAARRLLGDDALAEDVVQDVMVRLWDHPEIFDPRRGALRTFLLVLARNRCIDVLRSRRAQRRREEAGGVMIDIRDEVEEELAARDEVAGVARALDRLPAVQRQAIELAFYDGLTYRHIAKLLDLPEGTVKGRIRLGLARLRGAVTTETARPRDVVQ